MPPLDRRVFLKATVLAASSGLAARSVWSQPVGANGDVRVAVVGLNQKGAAHVRQLLGMPGVRVAGLCDVDPVVLARVVKMVGRDRPPVVAVTDARDLLSRSDIDALVIATSNHWHALLTVWACQAGKDVYIEKPVCHSVWEGGKMAEAALKYRRVVQAGTQLRSDPGLAQAVHYVRSGQLGKIQYVHSLCYRLRESIGRKLPWYPDGLNYDLYCGPAPVVPLERDQLHYDWHWMWDTGNGDLGNIGVHEFDLGRWFAGDPPLPRKIMSFGGRYVIGGAAETPNSHLAAYAYPDFPLYLEMRGLPAKPGVSSMDQVRGVREGVIVQCEHGYFAGHVGGAIYDPQGRRIKHFPGDGGAGHMANFFAAMRSRRTEDLAAPLATGRASSSGCLFGNISYRLGRPAAVTEVRRSLDGLRYGEEVLHRIQQHLAVHSVDLDRLPLTLGPWLELDPDTLEIAGVAGGDRAAVDYARFLHRGAARPPYRIPELV